MFVNLLTHSYFSLLMSSISIDDIIHYAIANKQKYVCLTDFNNMYGAMEFYNKAHQNNLIPIIGLHIVFNNQDVYLIAKDNKGYKNLLKISSNVMTNQSFNIKNYIDSLFVIADDIDKISWLKQKENGFSLNQSKTNPIAARSCFYENKEDVIYVNALNAIANEKKLEDYDNDKQLNDLYQLNEDSAKKMFSKQALDNLAKVIKPEIWFIVVATPPGLSIKKFNAFPLFSSVNINLAKSAIKWWHVSSDNSVWIKQKLSYK